MTILGLDFDPNSRWLSNMHQLKQGHFDPVFLSVYVIM